MSVSSPAAWAASLTCPSSIITFTAVTACPSAAVPSAASIIFLLTISPLTAPTTASASNPIAAAAASSIRLSIATSAFATCPTRSFSRRTTPPSPAIRLPIDITLENVHILTPGAYTFSASTPTGHKLEIKLDNVFADDPAFAFLRPGRGYHDGGRNLGNLGAEGRRRDDIQRSPRRASRSTATRLRSVP